MIAPIYTTSKNSYHNPLDKLITGYVEAPEARDDVRNFESFSIDLTRNGDLMSQENRRGDKGPMKLPLAGAAVELLHQTASTKNHALQSLTQNTDLMWIIASPVHLLETGACPPTSLYPAFGEVIDVDWTSDHVMLRLLESPLNVPIILAFSNEKSKIGRAHV